MDITVNDVAMAREIIENLLDELNINAIFFDIEPLDSQWELHIECKANNGWKMINIPIVKKTLLECNSNMSARNKVLNELRSSLMPCSTEKN